MSAIEKAKPLWPQYQNDQLNSKYEKCKHITEEIYKRIDITFQIKSLGTVSQSDESEQSDQIEIDSNDLSNGTDLFAYEQSDSLPSSASEGGVGAVGIGGGAERKCLTVNNNEIKKSATPIYKPPRKRFRKKVKKRAQKPPRTDTEGSSDEALPLSRMVADGRPREQAAECPVPKIVILTGGGAGKERIKDTKTKSVPLKPETTMKSPDTEPTSHPEPTKTQRVVENTQKNAKENTKVDVQDGHSKSKDLKSDQLKSKDLKSEQSKSRDLKSEQSKSKDLKSEQSKTKDLKSEQSKSKDVQSKSKDSQSKSKDVQLVQSKPKELQSKSKDVQLVQPKSKDAQLVQAKSKDGVEAISADVININVKTATETKKCSMCSLSFRGERGLRRHMAMTHILIPEQITRPKTRKSEAKAETV